MEFGEILKACRTRAKLSQEELAFRLSINQSDISKYENNTKEPSISLFRSWAMETQASEVVIAFMFGMDGITIMQHLSSLLIGCIHFL